jgi:hypothetical protein
MKTLLLLFSTLHLFVIAQNITINEIMSKNEETIIDLDNETSDWIELYNGTNQPIELTNYGLSDDDDELFKWIFPAINIPAYGSYLVFASGKNTISDTEIHTNFKISSLGEELYLSNTQGILIDVLPAKTLSEDQSYGRLPDGSNNLVLLDVASPGASNNSTNQIMFSVAPGYYQEEFQLELESALHDSIYYTLDGSMPTQNAQLYHNFLTIQNRNNEPNYFCEFPTSPDQSLISHKAWESPNSFIDKATIIRCRTYKNGIPSSKTYTNTYFVDENIHSKYDFPVISIVTEQANFFDVDSGIYVPGIHFDETNPEWTGNYCNTGRAWERPVHIEFFEKEGRLAFSQDAGVRIHGGKTRIVAQKSLKFYARKEYGTKEFNYKLLPSKENDKYKRFLLRSTMGAWGDESIIKDVLTQEITKDLKFESQSYQPIILYLNGEYWGIQNLRDRIDQHFFDYEYDLNSDSIDLIGGNYNLVFSGSNQHYLSLLSYIESHDLSIEEHYEYVLTQIDIDSYIDYQISEMFFANYDWPGNNMKLWRPQTEFGKWRWIFYDLDAGLRDYQKNMFQHCTLNKASVTWPNPPNSTFLFRNLLKNNNFKLDFSNRYASLLKFTFSPSFTLSKSNNLKKLYKEEINHHIGRWGFPSSIESWEDDIEDKLVYFLENRPCSVQEHITEFLNLTNYHFDCDTYKNTKRLVLSPNPNNGYFFIYNDTNETIRGNIQISSINGASIILEEYVYIDAYGRKELNTAHLPTGIYLLNYKSSVHTESLKFVIIK